MKKYRVIRIALLSIIALLATLSIAVIAIGPQRVLAQVQLWVGYLPGVGFINPEQTRVLAAPQEARLGNTFLQVQQVIAGPEKTVVVATLHSTPEEITLDTQWVGQVTLILPDGERLANRSASQRNQAGQVWAEIEYPALPVGIDQVTLEMPKLPIVTNATQEFWSVVLPLQGVRQAPTNASLSSAQETPSGAVVPNNLAVAPYTPKNVQTTNQGVTVRLVQAAQSAQETGLLLQINWNDPTWDFMGASAELRDDRNRSYPRLEPPPGSDTPYTGIPHGETTAQQMLRFAPLDPGAQHVTLTLDTISFEVHPKAQFQFDPGNQPSLGQTWSFVDDPTKRLKIAGFQVQVLQADLTAAPASDQVTVVNPPEATLLPQPTPLPGYACRLEFIIKVVPQAHAQLFVGPPSLVGENQGLAVASSTGDQNHDTIFLDLPKFPTTPLTIQLNDSSLFLRGGWQFSWDVPPVSSTTR